MKTRFLSLILLAALAPCARAATKLSTDEFRIDLRPSPRRVEPGDSERLTFSGRWADTAATASTIEIALDGAHYLTLSGGEGIFEWTPDRGGLFTFTHTACGSDGTPYGDVDEAQFLVDNYSFGDGDINASGWSGIYDGTAHSISVSSTVAGASVTFATAQSGPYSPTNPTRTNVGTTTVWYVVEAPFYLPVTNSTAISVSERSLSVAAESTTKVYGESDPALTYTVQGLVSGESLTGSLAREPGDNAGTYAIGQGTLAASANYALTFTPGTFTITKATMPGADAIAWGVSGAGARFTYDGTEHSVALTGLPSGVTATYTGNKATDAGDYTATAHLTYDTVNYQTIPDPAPLAWGVDRRPLSVTAEPKTKVYGESDPALTYTVQGLVSGESLTGSLAREPGDNAGTYAIGQGTVSASANYALTFTPGTFTITKATMPGADAIAWGVSGAGARFTYDGTEHSVALTGLPSGVTATYTGNKATDAGDYTATAHLTYDTVNYQTIPDPAPLSWGIDRRSATVRSVDATWTYDTTAHAKAEVSAEGFVAGEGVTARGFASVTDVTPAAGVANSFDYDWNAGTRAENYELAVEFGTLRVTPRLIGDDDANWDIRLGKNPTYDGTEKSAPVAQVCYVKPDGNLENIPYTLSGDKATDAGNYVLTISGTGNYAGSVNRDWAVMPRHLALASGSATWTYDGAAHSETAVSVGGDGFAPGEGADYSGFPTPTHVADAPASGIENAFSWTFRDGTKAGNYEVRATFGTVAVTPRAVTLTAPTKTKPYDGMPLTFGAGEISATRTGGSLGESALPDGESFAFSDFAAITDAGQCAATFAYAAGPGTDLANYVVTVAPGPTLTVTGSATEITVIAESASWVFDGTAHSAPAYATVNEDTLQPGDALAVTFADGCVVTHATDGPAGDGVVTNRIASVRVLRGGATDVTRNYTLKSYDGTLRVTRRPVEVRVAGTRVEAVYDGNEHVAESYGIETDDALYSLSDAVFSGTARAARTDAGATAMGLATGDFSNRNADFDVTFAVTDGGVVVSPADISGGGDGDFAIELGDDPLYNGTVQTVEIRSVTWKGLPVEHSLAGERATHAGSYALTVKGTGNFTGERTVRWGIRRRAVSMTSGSAEKVYDGTPLRNGAVAVSGDGFIGSEGATFDVTGSQTAAGSSENVFAHSLKAGTLASDYDITTVFGTLTVRKATHDVSRIAWSVAADAATFLYDGAEHGVALTGLPAGVTAEYAGNAATDAGAYTATAHLVYDTANYEPVADPAQLAWSITRRPITLFAASKDKPYDGWPLEVRPEDITAAGSGYAPGECFTYGDFASITDVGEIPATFSYADSATAKVANYDVTVQGGQTLKVTVGGDQISVTADSGTWVYDGETHRLASWTVFNGDKLLGGHVLDVAISSDSAVTTPAEGAVSNRFDHVRIVEEGTGRDMTRNYNLFVYEGELRVTNAQIGPNMSLHRTVEATYDGQAHSAAVDAPALLQPATVRYRVGDGTWGATSPEWTHAGDYAAEFEVSAEFYDPCTGRVDVAISPRPVTLASPTKSKPYDGTPLTFGAAEIAVGGDGIVTGEDFAYSNFSSITDAGRVAAAFDWAAGAGTLAADYAVTVVPGTLTVNRSAEEITVTAKDGEWVFDGTAHTLHEWTAENLGTLVSGDVLEVTFDAASAITEPGEVENIITGVRVLRGETDVSANYALSWWPGTLKVTPAQIGPQMDGISTAGAATYDGAGHGVPVAAPALLTASVTVRYAATADGPWGATPVEFTDAGAWTAFFRVESPHYDPYIGTTTMTIDPREVTLVSAGATKVYDGTPLRKNEVTVKTGSLQFVAGEGFSATCAGTVTDVGGVENAFDYTLTGGAKAGNYTIRKEYGWLRVTPATMDVEGIAANAGWRGVYDGAGHCIDVVVPYSRAVVSYALESGNEEAYGRENPQWTNFSTHVVYFKIVAPNYEPGYGAAIVEIGKRPLSVTAEPKTKVFGAADPVLTYVVDNLVPGDSVTGTLVRESGEAVGTYAIGQGLLSAGSNYAISFTGATFEITPGGIVVDANAGAVGYAGEYDGVAHGAALRVLNPASGATVQWAETSVGPWTDASPAYVDAGTNTAWWRVTAPNFAPVTGTARIAIAPRPISKASIGALTNEWYTGYPVEPVPSVSDAVPITTDDWTVAWENNVETGTARAVVTGRRNYCGNVVREFEIAFKPVVVIVIDLSNIAVGQGKWGTASLATNGIPVPEVRPGTRTELEVPNETPVALSFSPDPGFKLGGVVVDRRYWTMQDTWAFTALADRSFDAGYIPNPQSSVRWKKANATGHYHAQFSFPFHPGYGEALANLRFYFADRLQGGTPYAQLWDYTIPQSRRVADETGLDGKNYRFVQLDAGKMAGLAEGVRAVWGVSDSTLDSSTAAVPSAQRLIGLYIRKRVSPVSGEETDAGVENFIGAFSWETNGKTYYQPIGAGYENGIIAEKILDAEDLDTAEALGFDPAFLATAEPRCRVADFSFDPMSGAVDGCFEIFAVTPDGIEAESSGTTANAVMVLEASDSPTGPWNAVDEAGFPGPDEEGRPTFFDRRGADAEARFYRVRIEIRASHE